MALFFIIIIFFWQHFGRDLQEQKEPGHIADEREQNFKGGMDGRKYLCK